MRTLRAVAVTAAVALLGMAIPYLTSTAAHAAGPALRVTVTQVSTWTTGYGADVTITNTGDAPATGWTVAFDLPPGTTVSSSWSSTRTQSGQRYTFTNVSWNGTVNPGAAQTFGFNAAGIGTPANCTVNGALCTGGPGPSPSVPPSPSASASPSPSAPASPSASPSGPPSSQPPGGPVVDVSTAVHLSNALNSAIPGSTIRLAAGTYRGAFAITRPGTANARITLTGPRTAVLINDGPSGTGPSCPAPTAGWDSGYGLWLFGAPYWNLTGFTVAESKKGIVLDDSHHVTISGVHVHHTEDEGVHFRRSSADGIIRDSVIEYTGLVQPGYGEGVYLGSAGSNWACHGNSGGVDRSDRVQVLNNRIGPYVAAEHVDIKEGTFDGVIRGNTFDGRGISGQNSADSWVDAKGIGYLIENNTGTFAAPGTFVNGYETHNPATTPSFQNGCGNVWRGNSSNLGGVGQYAIRITSTSKCAGNLNAVYASNTVADATAGLTNIAVTP